MKINFRELIEALDYEEMVKIKNDLKYGGIHMKRLIDEKIKEKELMHKKYCSVCSAEIDSFNTRTYTLVFGPTDFKKKATFCALDCLEYFLSQLKDMEKMKGEEYKDE